MFQYIEPITITITLACIVLLLISCLCKHYSSEQYTVIKYDEEAPPPYTV